MRGMYEDERKAVNRVLLLGVACCAGVVLFYTPPPPPPPPPSALEGLFELGKAVNAVARQVASSVPSAEPIASTGTLSAAAPSAVATPPSSEASAAPSSAVRRVPRARPTGTATRKPGQSDVVDPWGDSWKSVK